MEHVTPDMIARVLDEAPKEYRHMHEMISGCKCGTVFTSLDGEYFVYVGVDVGNPTFPLMATRVRDRSPFKFPVSIFERVRRASEGE